MAVVGRSRVRLDRDFEGGGRGRIVLVVLVVLTVLVVGVSVAGSPRRKQRQAGIDTLAYLDQVRPAAQRSTTAGRSVASLRDNALQLKADSITRELGRIQGECDGVLSTVRGLHPPQDAEVAHDLLVGAMAERAAGVKALRQAMGLALDPAKSASSAVDALVEVGRDLAASDRSYKLFLDSLPSRDQAPAPSQWVSDDTAWTPLVVGGYVTALRAGANTAPVHDVAVLMASPDPPPVGKEGSLGVLPTERTLKVQVVVADLGNREERNVTVSVAVIPVGGGTLDTARDFFDFTPGQRRVVQFSNLRLPAAGTQFSLAAKIGPVNGDANPSNDDLLTTYVLR